MNDKWHRWTLADTALAVMWLAVIAAFVLAIVERIR
jgi:hypothetical protein